MAYDVELAERVRDAVAALAMDEKAMFGGLAFLLDGRMVVAVSGSGGLLVRVDPDRAEQLLGEPGVAEFLMRGRPMRGWVRVEAQVVTDDAALDDWVGRAVEAARVVPRSPRRRARSS